MDEEVSIGKGRDPRGGGGGGWEGRGLVMDAKMSWTAPGKG